MVNVTLNLYNGEIDIAISLIKSFWKEHNNYESSTEDAKEDLLDWTKEGHKFYFIKLDNEYVGFVHLGNRGGEIDWLEDIYVMARHQNKGIGTSAIKQVEEIVRQYSESLYMEAAARNESAIRLYYKMGYDCLNTITVRKDFIPENHEVIRNETIYGQMYDIKKYRN